MNMQVEKDLIASIDICSKRKYNKKEYKSVRLLPSRSLKFLKNYKMKNRDVLTKCNSISEVLDIISYEANTSVYSSNRLDEYFLNLEKALFNLDYNDYISYIFYKPFSKEYYDKIKSDLDDKTRYFFDELYKNVSEKEISARLCNLREIDYNVMVRYVRYLLKPKYYKMAESFKNHKLTFTLCKDVSVPLYFDDESFNFINLSYNIDVLDKDRLKYIIQKIKEDFVPLLKEYGKIQGFVGESDIELSDFKKIITRSIDDPNTINNDCKKDYAYVYKVK